MLNITTVTPAAAAAWMIKLAALTGSNLLLLLLWLLLPPAGAYAASGPDFAAAEGLLQSAVSCFGAAVEATPEDTRCVWSVWGLSTPASSNT